MYKLDININRISYKGIIVTNIAKQESFYLKNGHS